jgi:hypothetical protein
MSDGFFFGELSEFKKDLMRDIKNTFPKETEKFIKTETGKCLKVAKKIGKSNVGTSKGTKKNWIESKSYHKGFKVGKIYKYGNDLCCRAYNKSPHAHLIEDGHVNADGSFTKGKFVFKKAELQFSSEFEKDVEDFLFNYFDDTTGK